MDGAEGCHTEWSKSTLHLNGPLAQCVDHLLWQKLLLEVVLLCSHWPHRAKPIISFHGNPFAHREIKGSVQFSSVVSNSLQPHEPQHTRPPCPSPTPGVHPNPCPLSWWCHPPISSFVVPFSSCPQSLPASGSFPMSQLFTSHVHKHLTILIPACASSSPAFLMMYSAYKLNKQGDNIQPWRTAFPIWNQSVVPCSCCIQGLTSFSIDSYAKSHLPDCRAANTHQVSRVGFLVPGTFMDPLIISFFKKIGCHLLLKVWVLEFAHMDSSLLQPIWTGCSWVDLVLDHDHKLEQSLPTGERR